jgi:hypothetical protein
VVDINLLDEVEINLSVIVSVVVIVVLIDVDEELVVILVAVVVPFIVVRAVTVSGATVVEVIENSVEEPPT